MMPAALIRGKEIAATIQEELTAEVQQLQARGIVPGLVTVLVGDDPASQSYVRAKNKTAHALGIHSEQRSLPATTTEVELLELIASYNRNSAIHGILVQLPLPRHINESNILSSIDPAKDVDGFHPVNVGKMLLGEPCFLPCTPHGIIELLQRSGVETSGAEVVVVGRSNIVGKPVANLLIQKRTGGNATVTLCHTGTKNVADKVRAADVVIAATGQTHMVKADWVKPGAVVLDVGVSRVYDEAAGKYKIAGDIDPAVGEVASWVSPNPGGVGPMTRAMLLSNVVKAAEQAAQ